MDQMVKTTQEWLNRTYGNDSRFNIIPTNGETGCTTIYALIRALQIELGIQYTADSFGPSTQSLFKQRYPSGIIQQEYPSTFESNIYGIIQGALWCKGYSTGSSDITKHFYGGTGNAIIKLKKDAGMSNPDSSVTLNVMIALLSMNQYVTLIDYGGTDEIREIQQRLNQNYEDYIGLIPCDGVYGRQMNLALITVMQAIEGLSPLEATGYFGDTTKRLCPILPDTANVLEKYKENAAVKLLRYALCCNGYSIDISSEEFDSTLVSKIKEFQQHYILTVTGTANLDTWMSLLLSKGNPDRSAKACDCATILTQGKATSLYNAGYRFVGRYLTGTVGIAHEPKSLTKGELFNIFNAGLNVFAIYQDNDPSVEYYNLMQGAADATKAIKAAKELGIPYGEIIYFAVDYDVMDGQVTSNIFPYFLGIANVMKSNLNIYKVGVYGARNVCSRMSKANLSCSSFVSDMSTGFSGNMGYPIPSDWAFDQFHEYMFSSTDGEFGLDKDAYSGRYSGFNKLINHIDDEVQDEETDKLILEKARKFLNVFDLKYNGEITTNKEIVADLGPIEVKVIVGRTKNLLPENGENYVTLSVVNGKIQDPQYTLAEKTYNNFTTSLKTQIDGNNNMSAMMSLAIEVENGSISYSIGINDKNQLFYTYYVEHELKLNKVMYFEMTVTIKEPKKYLETESEWDEIKEKVAKGVIIVAVGAIVAVALIYVGIPALVAAPGLLLEIFNKATLSAL